MSIEWHYNSNAPWHFKIRSALHLNLVKTKCDLKMQSHACRFSLFFDLSSFGSFIGSHVFYRIRTQGFHILSPILCRLSYTEQACYIQNTETYGAVIITVRKLLQVLNALPSLVFISVGNCKDMYLLVGILHLTKKFPQAHRAVE